MIYQTALSAINAVSCSLIAIRILFFRRKNAKYSFPAAIIAYFLMISTSCVTIRILTETYIPGDWAQTLINIFLCGAVYSTSGNVAQLFKGDQDVRF